MERGVSVEMFSIVVKRLCKTFGSKPVPPEMLNRWIRDIGNIEREYEALPMPEVAKLAKKRKRGAADGGQT